MSTTRTDRRSATLAVASAALGVAVLIALFAFQRDPQPLWLWAIFAVAFVSLEFSSVEVNDRLFVSSSRMVAFAGMVIFDRESAVLGVTLMSAVAVLHPDDLRMRRWRQPAYNFGQLVLSTALGALALVPFLPAEGLEIGDVPKLVMGAALASLVYNWVNFRLVALYVRVVYRERSVRPWSRMLENHIALAALGAYGSLLGASYVLVGPVALPLMFITFLVGHVGFVSYSRLREAHEATLRGFVKSIEALDSFTKGHTQRVAEFCRITGDRLGLSPGRHEVLRWAALIHDVGKVAVPVELLRREGSLDVSGREQVYRHMEIVEEKLARVAFLEPAIALVAELRTLSAGASLEARILGVADAFDVMTTSRSYRAAITQSAAFAALRQETDRYGSDVVESLIAAVEAGGTVYGSPEEAAAAEVERLVRERASRA